MSNHIQFAENLRRKCEKYETIADICRSIGINRQQFNKYLAGTAIPNARTLRKICVFLDVPEGELFQQSTESASVIAIAKKPVKVSEPFRFLIGNNQNFNFKAPNLPRGSYFCYCAFPKAPGIFVRSLIRIWSQSNSTKFVRLISFNTPGTKGARIGRSRHGGVVIANDTEFYMLGVNRYSPREMSLLTIDKGNAMGQQFFTGMLLTRSGSGSLSLRVCLVLQNEKVGMRQLIQKLGMIHSTDEEIEPAVLAALTGDLYLSAAG